MQWEMEEEEQEEDEEEEELDILSIGSEYRKAKYEVD